MELYQIGLIEASEGLRAGDFSSEELTRSVLERTDNVEDKVHSYVTWLPERAVEEAREADKRLLKNNHPPPLLGIPIAVKDIFCTRGIPTTCSSRILSNFIPPYNATAVEKLLGAGAVILGKTNMDEFAMGSSTETSFYGITRNPWCLDRVPGGSSGGSAAAVAADECIGAIGTDTGGSIRQPAAMCGIVGLKPTYGRVSRFGMIAFASSLDQGGPMTKDVKDCAFLLNVISGYDTRDSTSVNLPVPDFLEDIDRGIEGRCIGLPKEYFVEGMEGEVKEAVKKSLDILEGLGVELKEISLPHTDYALAAYYILAPAEASSNLARYDGVKYGYRARDNPNLMELYLKTRSEGFGAEVKRRIMIGTYALSSGYYDAYYLKAARVRHLIKGDFSSAFEDVDAIVTPTSPTPAFKLGERADDPLEMYLSDIFTIPCNLAGLPGVSIPCGLTKDGLPIGLQIIGRPFEEKGILQVARALENALPWERKELDI